MVTIDGQPLAELANRGDFFATSMQPIQRLPEFVRLVFFSDQQRISIVIPATAFANIAWLIAHCPDCVMN